MKNVLRIGTAFFLSVVICLCFDAAAFAEDTVTASGTCGADGDNLTWTLYDTGELVIEGTGEMADYYFGEDSPWYSNREQIISVTIGDNVTSIGDFALYNCSRLIDVTIPDSVTSINWAAFCGCSSLASITIPAGVTKIDTTVFSGCNSLTGIMLPAGVTSIGGGAFSGCSSLKSITIPKSVTMPFSSAVA